MLRCRQMSENSSWRRFVISNSVRAKDKISGLCLEMTINSLPLSMKLIRSFISELLGYHVLYRFELAGLSSDVY
jgi:hypothetical protein